MSIHTEKKIADYFALLGLFNAIRRAQHRQRRCERYVSHEIHKHGSNRSTVIVLISLSPGSTEVPCYQSPCNDPMIESVVQVTQEKTFTNDAIFTDDPLNNVRRIR